MSATELVYLTDMQALTASAHVMAIENVDGRSVVIVDQTIFYPQGGRLHGLPTTPRERSAFLSISIVHRGARLLWITRALLH